MAPKAKKARRATAQQSVDAMSRRAAGDAAPEDDGPKPPSARDFSDLALVENHESKPIWVCLQAFESGSWLMPTRRQLRAEAYTALIHGATGIM